MPYTETSASDLYLRVRRKEGRLYSDGMVANLPSVQASDPLSKEWRARTGSLNRLKQYLRGLHRPLKILEVGCGNGWLSRRLSEMGGVRVCGLDRNHVELSQGARLFGRNNLTFLNADIFRAPFHAGAFDVIVLASSIQYFPDLNALIQGLRNLLDGVGQIHILDTPLYDRAEVEAARERTLRYYSDLGFPEMARHYHHHTYEELEKYSPRWLYRPQSFEARIDRVLGRPSSPFAWLCICRT